MIIFLCLFGYDIICYDIIISLKCTGEACVKFNGMKLLKPKKYNLYKTKWFGINPYYIQLPELFDIL